MSDPKKLAHIVLDQAVLIQLLGLPEDAQVYRVELAADDRVHIHLRQVGQEVQEGCVAPASVGVVTESQEYGPYRLRTIDWGFCRKQLA